MNFITGQYYKASSLGKWAIWLCEGKVLRLICTNQHHYENYTMETSEASIHCDWEPISFEELEENKARVL